MKQILVISFIVLLTLGTACAWISPSSDAASEGIKVHGDWTVTVTNPDGTLDAVHEFNNDLFNMGADLLTALLAGETTINTDPSVNSHTIQTRLIEDSSDFMDGIWCGSSGSMGSIVSRSGRSFSWKATALRDIDRGSPLRLTASCVLYFDEPENELRIREVQTNFRTVASTWQPTNFLVNIGGSSGIFMNGLSASLTRKGGLDITVKHNQHMVITVIISFS